MEIEEAVEPHKWNEADQAEHSRAVKRIRIERKLREAMKFLSFLVLVSLWWNSYKMFVLLQEAVSLLEVISGK